MTNNKRALGRGLESLFQDEAISVEKLEETIIETARKEEIREIKLTDLRSNPYQPRKTFNEESLSELTESIKEHGVFQPIIIKKSIKGYEIVAGERRVKASTNAGKETIPAIIRNFTDEQMMEIALLENLQREDLSAIEEASAYMSLIKAMDLTQDQLAKRLGKSRSHITNMIGLLRLPKKIQEMISNQQISMGHARVLSKLENEEQIEILAKRIIKEGLSVRKTEIIAEGNKYARVNQINRGKKPESEYKYVENIMTEKLGTKINIRKNKIEISFSSEKDLSRILEILNIEE